MSKTIAVLTSGGDAPGMNAAIRAVTRCALDRGWQGFGVRRGYAGMIEGLFEPLNPRSVGGILVGMRQGPVAATPLAEVVRAQKPMDPELFALTRVLAT